MNVNVPIPGSLWSVSELGVRVYVESFSPLRPWRHRILSNGEFVVFMQSGLRPSPPPYTSQAVSWIRILIPGGIEALAPAEDWWENFRPIQDSPPHHNK